VGEMIQEEKECDRLGGESPEKREEYQERHGVVIGTTANRIKVFKIQLLCVLKREYEI
jgi:hypothetical protein